MPVVMGANSKPHGLGRLTQTFTVYVLVSHVLFSLLIRRSSEPQLTKYFERVEHRRPIESTDTTKDVDVPWRAMRLTPTEYYVS